MADNGKYYYLKVKENFFETDEMKILEGMKDGYIYGNILLKLYLRSLKNEGRLMYRNRIPYTPEILAELVGHEVGTVEKALKIFRELDLIEVLDNGAIYMMDIQNFIGRSSTEADRRRAYYNRVKEEKEAISAGTTEKIEEKKETPEPKKKESKPKRETTVQIFERLAQEYDLPDMITDKMVEWCMYKTERKEPYKEQGMKALLRRVEKNVKQYGEERICELIDTCMSSNWVGIIWKILEEEQQKKSSGSPIKSRVSEVDNW